MQFDTKKIKDYKELLLVFCSFFIVFIIGINRIATVTGELMLSVKKHKVQLIKVTRAKKDIKQLENKEQEDLLGKSKLRPVFSDPASISDDSITSFGTMFEDITDYIKMNGLMLRTIEYNINPKNDKIYTSFPLLYNVCAVNVFALGTYSQIQGFLKDMLIYPYFINLDEISIQPYEKNRNYLLVNMTLNLYSVKSKNAKSPLPGTASQPSAQASSPSSESSVQPSGAQLQTSTQTGTRQPDLPQPGI